MTADLPSLTKRIAWEIAPPGSDEAERIGYWPPGEVVNWHYRRSGSCRAGEPVRRQYVLPVRVVRDDERGLVAWLAPGTVGIGPVRTDSRPVSRGPEVDFDYPWRMALREWVGGGCLRIAPTGLPWSIWLAWRNGEFVDWYVNLEDAHLRDADGIYTCDHVLDLIVKPSGELIRKDEDELAIALQQGHLTQQQVAAIENNAAVAEHYVREGAWPFEPCWCEWQPDPGWPVPTVPAGMLDGLTR